MAETFLTTKTFYLLLNVRDGLSITDISKTSEISPNFCVKRIGDFTKIGLCTKKKENRKQLIYLTDKGKTIRKNALQIYHLVHYDRNPNQPERVASD